MKKQRKLIIILTLTIILSSIPLTGFAVSGDTLTTREALTTELSPEFENRNPSITFNFPQTEEFYFNEFQELNDYILNSLDTARSNISSFDNYNIFIIDVDLEAYDLSDGRIYLGGITFNTHYKNDTADINYATRTVQGKIQEYRTLQPEITDAQLIHKMYMWINNTLTYGTYSDASNPEPTTEPEKSEWIANRIAERSLTNAINGEIVVCEGYAFLLNTVLKEVGVQHSLIDGQIIDGAAHIWNLAQVDGEWYHIDSTWGQSDYEAYKQYALDQGYDLEFAENWASEQVAIQNEKYFLTSKDVMSTTHMWDSGSFINSNNTLIYDYQLATDYIDGPFVKEIDTSALENLILDSQNLLGSTNISVDGNDILPENTWVTQVEMDSFTNSIQSAQTFISSIQEINYDITQDQVDSEYNLLNSAYTTFESSLNQGTYEEVVLDTTELEALILEGNTLTTNTLISIDGSDIDKDKYWVTQETMDSLSAQITDSQNLINSVDTNDVSQEEIDLKASSLSSEITSFNNAKSLGTYEEIIYKTKEELVDLYSNSLELTNISVYEVESDFENATVGEDYLNSQLIKDNFITVRNQTSDLISTLDDGEMSVEIEDTYNLLSQEIQNVENNILTVTEDLIPEEEVVTETKATETMDIQTEISEGYATISVENLNVNKNVRTISVINSSGSIIKRVIYTDTLEYDIEESGDYTIEIMYRDYSKIQEPINITLPEKEVVDTTPVIDVSITPLDGKSLVEITASSENYGMRTLEVLQNGSRIERAIYKEFMSIELEPGEYQIKAMNRNYETSTKSFIVD